MKDIVVLGGPNGAGKTTAAQLVVPAMLGITELVNADEIARGLSPFDPDGAALAAGRLMLERMHELARGQRSFAIETTCAGRGHVRFLQNCKRDGWRITLIFLWLPSSKLAIERVRDRVAAGGHAIPDSIVERRYSKGLVNLLKLYLPLADIAVVYDNTGSKPLLIADRLPDGDLRVHDAARWAAIEGASGCPI